MPVDPSSELVVVGRFGTPHGVAGWVRVASFTHPGDNVASYRPWLIDEAGAQRVVEMTEFKAHGQGFVARLNGVTDREQAGRFTGLDIKVPRAALPEPADGDEYYWRDLIGLEVHNDDGSSLGRVTSLLETGAHDVLVVEGSGGERLIPFVAAWVLAVDRPAGVIRVRWQDPA